MFRPLIDVTPVESSVLPVPKVLDALSLSEASTLEVNSIEATPTKLSKPAIRSSLRASTFDGILATFFSCATGGVLLTNFLLELGASSVEIGLLASIPMVVNFLQPVGAYIADRTSSRHWYTLLIFGVSRLLWLPLIFGISFFCLHPTESHQLVQWTLGIVLVTHVLGAFGSPSWVSWMAALVPHRLRGRYFGLRNSAANLTNLLSMPLLGLVVASWGGGTIQGFGVVLALAVVAGIASLGFQFLMADINPQAQGVEEAEKVSEGEVSSLLKNKNFLVFLLYWGLWMFAVNLSAPFFNLYLLHDLGLDVSWVTFYSSLTAGANLAMLLIWGKLADRWGNRPLLVLVGVLVAVMPLFWLGTSSNGMSLWLWLPLLNLLMGGTWAAIDLCSSNIQMAIAPMKGSSTYFAIAAAVSGLGGALGTTAGGFLADFTRTGGLPGLFALSALVRVVAILPLFFVREPKSYSLIRLLQGFPGLRLRLKFNRVS